MKKLWKALERRNPFRAVYPEEARKWKKWAAKFYVPMSGFFYPFSGINRAYRKFLAQEGEAVFARVLDSLQISFEIRGGSIESIPQSGSLIVISNHPTGGIDGVLLARLLEQRGREFRIMVMAETGLERVAELQDYILPVDLRDNVADPGKNLKALRESLQWLKAGNCLIVFPAGGLPARDKETGLIQEPAWKNNVIKYLSKTQASILPVYLQMQSSKFYQWMGDRNESFRVGLLGEQIIRLKRKSVPLAIGQPISSATIDRQSAESIESLKSYLRSAVFDLSSSFEDTETDSLKSFS